MFFFRDSTVTSFPFFFSYTEMNFGLERTRRLLDALNKPDERTKIIHVAGTNGKGSICAYISTVLHTCGYSVGRFNSPHLIEPRDSFNIDGEAVSQAAYEEAAEHVRELNASCSIGASSFECLVATAFYLFDKAHVEFVVLEVGLGGREDATNAIQRPVMAIIASIGIDHAQILGNTLQAIASAKAGIMKPQCPVVIAPQDQEAALETLVNHAKETRCPYVLVRPSEWVGDQLCQLQITSKQYTYPIRLHGDYQRMNSATAVTALDWLARLGLIHLTEEHVSAGMGNTRWRGRLDWITSTEVPSLKAFQLDRILVDGAHNSPAAIALHNYVESLRKKKVIWIMGATVGKDVGDMLNTLVQADDILLTVSFSQPQGMPWIQSMDPCDMIRQTDKEATGCTSLKQALEKAGSICGQEDLVVLCGSLYLAADLYRLLTP